MRLEGPLLLLAPSHERPHFLAQSGDLLLGLLGPLLGRRPLRVALAVSAGERENQIVGPYLHPGHLGCGLIQP